MATKTKELVHVKDLVIKYQAFTALKDVSFTINEQDFIAVIGANGSGKTTLVKALLGLF